MNTLKQFFSWHWDLAGFLASGLCAIHCLAWPILLTLPAFGSSHLANIPWLETAFVVLALVIAIWTMGHGYLRVHRSWRPLAWALVGFAVIAVGKLVFESWETWGTVIGGILVARGHVENWRYIGKCAKPKSVQAEPNI